MKKEGNVFQAVTVAVFIGLMILGFIIFAVSKNTTEPGENIGVVNIWGTLPQETMNKVLSQIRSMLPKGFDGTINYLVFDEETFTDDLVEALAAGTGPDLVILKHNDIIAQRNKIFILGFEAYINQRNYIDSYIDGAQIFTESNGIVAFPFTVDPLVMYWNKDILSREIIVEPPRYWEEINLLSPKITKQDQRAGIEQATVSFGEYRNVTNAKEIVSALLLQAGDPISVYNSLQQLQIVLGNANEVDNSRPGESAMRFFTQFSNPIKSVYSWNRSLPESKRAFLSGDLAFYFGFASEHESLRKANPNLNFDIAPFPQIKDDLTPVTYGEMTGVALMKSSPNQLGAHRVQKLLSSNPIFEILQTDLRLPPVSKQLLKNPPSDAIFPILYEAAVISRSWLEPDSDSVDVIFKDMVESISSGRLSPSGALGEASAELDLLLR